MPTSFATTAMGLRYGGAHNRWNLAQPCCLSCAYSPCTCCLEGCSCLQYCYGCDTLLLQVQLLCLLHLLPLPPSPHVVLWA